LDEPTFWQELSKAPTYQLDERLWYRNITFGGMNRMKPEIKQILENLEENDKKHVIEYIENLENENNKLKRNLEIISQILADTFENVQVIGTTVKNIVRIMSPVLRPRRQGVDQT